MEKNNKNLNVPNLRFPEFSGEWEKFRNCTLFKVISEKNKNYEFSTVLSASQNEGMVLRDSLGIDIKFEEDSIKTYKIVRNGDYVAHLRSFQGGFAFSDKTGVCSPAYTILRPSETISYGFLKPYFMSRKFIDSLRIVTYGIRDGKSISVEEWLKLYTCIPKKNEQQKISKFLKLIDNRIETQKKIIEKYESLIKGITDKLFYTPHVYFLRSFGTLYKDAGEGGTPSTSNPQYYEDGTIPFIKIDDLSQKYLVAHKDCITELGLRNSSAWLIPTGSVLYSNGATIGAISINTYPVSTKQGILGIVPNDCVCAEYLYYLMTSKYFRKQVHRIITEGTMRTAYLKDINRILCPVPDKNEQQSLAKSISLVTRKIEIEKATLKAFILQKRYLLSHLFI